MITFPLYVQEKDSGEFKMYPGYDTIQHSLEAIDVENKEYMIWDASGSPLDYANDPDGNLVLCAGASGAPALKSELVKRITAFKCCVGVDVQHMAIGEMFSMVKAEQERRDWGLFAIWRRIRAKWQRALPR